MADTLWAEPPWSPGVNNVNPPIWNQNGSPQTANFYVTGSGRFDANNYGNAYCTPSGSKVCGADNGSIWGVVGESNNGYGLYGSSVTSYGIYASSATSYAGYFSGPIYVNGTISQGGKAVCLEDGTNCLASSGFWSASGNNIYNNNTGNVGIGTALSLYPLHIQSANKYVAIQTSGNNAGDNSGFIFKTSALTSDNYFKGGIFYQSTADGNGRGNLIFAQNNVNDTSNVTPAQAVMTILANGNVGIGSTNPGERLEVNGRLVIAQTTAPTTTANKLYNVGGNLYWNGTQLGAGGSSQWQNGTGGIIYYNGGNVGIGTATPSSPLSVTKQWSSSSSANLSAVFDSYGDANRLTLRRAGGTIAAPTAIANGDALGNINFRGYNGTAFATTAQASISAVAGENFTSSANGTSLVFGTTPLGSATGAERMRIDPAGNVGIGTTSPNAKLTVSANTGNLPVPPVGTLLHLGSADAVANIVVLDAFGAVPASIAGGSLQFRTAEGTVASPTRITTGETIGEINFAGYGSTRYIAASTAKIAAYSTENWTDSTGASRLTFFTRPSNTTAIATERMTIDQNGNIGIGTVIPTQLLSVNQGTDVAVPALGADGGSFSIKTAGVRGLIAGSLAGGSVFMQVQRTDGTATAYNLLLQPNGGNVGIGTSLPSTKLEVTGVASTTAAQLAIGPVGNSGSVVSLPGKLRFKSTFDAYSTDQNPRVSAQILSGYDGGVWGNEYLAFGVGGAGDAGNDPTERMRLTSGGLNVIGDITQGGVKVCLADGTNCLSGGGSMPGNTGTDWASSTVTFPSSGDYVYALAYGNNGAFVAAKTVNGSCGTYYMISTDGLAWTSSGSQTTITRAIAYGNNRYVAVGGYVDYLNCGGGMGAKIVSSIDGVTWGNGTGPGLTSTNFSSVTYGNGMFVAVADTCGGADCTNFQVVATSPDGINWTMRTAGSANQWKSVTYGNGMFVAVSGTGTGNRVMTSSDGITWTSRTSASNNNWQSVTYGNGLFVAVASSGTGNRVMTSPDGITWTSRTSAADYSWSHIIYANNLYVVSSSGTTYIMTSANGILWTLKNVYATGGWSKWAMSPAKLLTISGGGSSGVALYSPPATGSSAGGAEQSLYLYGTNPSSLACPSGWTDAGAGQNSVSFGSYATYTYVRSCYKLGASCRTLYLYNTNPSSMSCPSGWTDAGAGQNSVGFGSYATYTYARSCYMCN